MRSEHRQTGEPTARDARAGETGGDMEQQLPVTGAWRPGDPEGRRKFLTFASERPFALDGGEVLTEVTIAYETWGTLAEDASNAVLVCHAPAR